MIRRSKLEPSRRKSWRVGEAHLRISAWTTPIRTGRQWRKGCYISSLGIALISQWRDANGKAGTMIEAVDRWGHLHRRWWERAHPDRTCSRLARLMLEELP